MRLLSPARPNDAVGRAEARDDRLQRQLPSLVRGHGRRHLDAAGIFDERAVHFAEMDVGHGSELVNQQGPDVGCTGRAAIDRDEVVLLFLGRLDRLSVRSLSEAMAFEFMEVSP